MPPHTPRWCKGYGNDRSHRRDAERAEKAENAENGNLRVFNRTAPDNMSGTYAGKH